jgi:hypothetical protein
MIRSTWPSLQQLTMHVYTVIVCGHRNHDIEARGVMCEGLQSYCSASSRWIPDESVERYIYAAAQNKSVDSDAAAVIVHQHLNSLTCSRAH